jgi:hypothetical protein
MRGVRKREADGEGGSNLAIASRRRQGARAHQQTLDTVTRHHARVAIGHCLSRMREGIFSHPQAAPYQAHEPRKPWIARQSKPLNRNVEFGSRRPAMKTIVSALIALSVLAGIAAPASALDAKSFYEQLDRQSGN